MIRREFKFEMGEGVFFTLPLKREAMKRGVKLRRGYIKRACIGGFTVSNNCDF